MALRRLGSSSVSGLLSSLGREAGPSSCRLGSTSRLPAPRNTLLFSTSASINAVGAKKKPPTQARKAVAKKRSPNVKGAAGGGGAAKTKQLNSKGRTTRYRVGSSPKEEQLSMAKISEKIQPKPSMEHLQEFRPEVITPDRLGEVMAWSRDTLGALNFPHGFGKTIPFIRRTASMPRPYTMVRSSTLALLEMMDKSRTEATDNTIVRAPLGYGSSTLLLQAVSYALESSWIVVYVPRPFTHVDSSSPYAYSKALQTYVQPQLTRHLLLGIKSVNEGHLRDIATPNGAITLPGGAGKIEGGTSLSEVIKTGLADGVSPDVAQVVLEVVLRTLVQQRERPVLLAIDGIQMLYSKSWYRDPDFSMLQSYELGVPRALQAALRRTGTGSFGGIQSGMSLSAFDLGYAKWPVPDAMRKALMFKPAVDPYKTVDEGMLSLVQEAQFRVWDVSNAPITHREAVSLYEAARAENTFWSRHNDETLVSKLVESGGNISTFHRSLQGSML